MSSDKDEKQEASSTTSTALIPVATSLIQIVPSTNVSSMLQKALLPAAATPVVMKSYGAAQLAQVQIDYVPTLEYLDDVVNKKGKLLVLSSSLDIKKWCKDRNVMMARFDPSVHYSQGGMAFSTTKCTRDFCTANALQFPLCKVISSSFQKGKLGSYRADQNDIKAELDEDQKGGMKDDTRAKKEKALTTHLDKAKGYLKVSLGAFNAERTASITVGGGKTYATVWSPDWMASVINCVLYMLISIWDRYQTTPPGVNKAPFRRIRVLGDQLMKQCKGFEGAANELVAHFQFAALMLLRNKTVFKIDGLFVVPIDVAAQDDENSLDEEQRLERNKTLIKTIRDMKNPIEIVLYFIVSRLLGPKQDGTGVQMKFVHDFFEQGTFASFDLPEGIIDWNSNLGGQILSLQNGILTSKQLQDLAYDDKRRDGRLAFRPMCQWLTVPGQPDDAKKVQPQLKVHIDRGHQIVPFGYLEMYQADVVRADDEVKNLEMTWSWRAQLDGVRSLRTGVSVVDPLANKRESYLDDDGGDPGSSATEEDPLMVGLTAEEHQALMEDIPTEAFDVSKEAAKNLAARIKAKDLDGQKSANKAFDKHVENVSKDPNKYAWQIKNKEKLVAQKAIEFKKEDEVADADMIKAADSVSSNKPPSSPQPQQAAAAAAAPKSPVRETTTKKRKVDSEEAPPPAQKEKEKKKQKTIPSSPAKEVLKGKKAHKSKIDRLDEQD
jgi:hypothetical protein